MEGVARASFSETAGSGRTSARFPPAVPRAESRSQREGTPFAIAQKKKEEEEKEYRNKRIYGSEIPLSQRGRYPLLGFRSPSRGRLTFASYRWRKIHSITNTRRFFEIFLPQNGGVVARDIRENVIIFPQWRREGGFNPSRDSWLGINHI